MALRGAARPTSRTQLHEHLQVVDVGRRRGAAVIFILVHLLQLRRQPRADIGASRQAQVQAAQAARSSGVGWFSFIKITMNGGVNSVLVA